MGLPIIGDVWDAVSGVFSDVAGWAVDSVISAITTWIIAGVLALIEAIWSVMDTTTRPIVTADWFSGSSSSPFKLALGIGAVMMLFTLMAAVIRAVLAGSPGGIAKAIGRDLPSAVLTMVGTIAFTQLALDLSDSTGDWVWAGIRADAAHALENLAIVMRTGLPGSAFLGVIMAIGLMLAMLFLWVTLFIRASLIYLVIVFAAAFAWPMMVFPPLRDTAKKAGELLLALIICKPVIILALSVGVSAMAGFASADRPGGGTSLGSELGTLMVGVITFGLSAFMPFLVWKLMPLVTAAVVAQGVAGSPMRAAQSAMQMQYYGSSAMQRLAGGGKVPGVTASGRAAGTARAGGGSALPAGSAAVATAPVAAAQITTGAATAAVTAATTPANPTPPGPGQSSGNV